METLSTTDAQHIMLAAQGLLQPAPAPASPESVLDCIRQMGLLQIDTISVVARSPYLVLFSRLGPYSPSWLDAHLAQQSLFEYWAHAACFIPIEDYAYFRRDMLEGSRHTFTDSGWLDDRVDVVEQVRQRIRTEGPLRSADFDQSKRRGTWWDWKDEKIILEHLYNRGELMIARRDRFQRVYDLQERVLPDWTDHHLPDAAVVRTELVKRSVRCLGIARPEWVADYYRLSKRGLPGLLEALVQTGDLLRVSVAGLEGPAYMHPQHQNLLEKTAAGQLTPTLTALLSPFDPLVWDRARVRQLFKFDYSLEAYLPPPKRQYGYFTLPILWRGRLVGRLDAKAHRREGRFEVRGLFLEEAAQVNDLLLHDLAQAVRSCATWHGCAEVSVSASNPADVIEALKSKMAAI